MLILTLSHVTQNNLIVLLFKINITLKPVILSLDCLYLNTQQKIS